ncbi:MAG: DUF11 domain-containing protein [Thermoflexales bacterium]|nr:DUF11 domain-containing protein [Thermoflexales bacterium]
MHRTRLLAGLLIFIVATGGLPRQALAAPPSLKDPPPRRPPTALERAEAVPARSDTPQRISAPDLGPVELVNAARLTFQSYRDNNYEIYVANGDSSIETRVTNNSASDIEPRLSRGADRIVFASKRDGNYEIYGVGIDGSNLRRLTYEASDDLDPNWSPNGARIVFSTMRNGNSDIYVMNADGGGLTRLTTDGADDYSPSWSPDGNSIVFISERGAPANTGGRVWLMNADGSNQHQLYDAPFAGGPMFSPDGGRIAFQADMNTDYWLDLAWMNATGGVAYVTAWGSAQWLTDQVMGSWSPDGKYIAATSLLYGYCGASLCLSQLQTYYYDVVVGYSLGRRLTSSGYDFGPDWKTTDITPPTSNVLALPAVSPADFTVTWTGSAGDGPIQQFDFEIQVRDGLAGTWTTIVTSAWNAPNSTTYHGVSGHTYYFRSRAKDFVLNVEAWPSDVDAFTTIETLAPESSVMAVDPFTRTPALTLQWSGADPGGSGITYYDLQYRIGAAGAWVPYLTATTATSTTFPVDRGYTYFFRSRATDAATNVEAWPPGDGDTNSTIYTWRGTGHVYDIRDAPLEQASATFNRGGTPDVRTTNTSGIYASVLVTTTPTISATWSKVGYGLQPLTPFTSAQDLTFDVYLPPLDNIISLPDFEASSLAGSSWQANGLPLARPTTERAHTGLSALTLGGLRPSAPINVSNSISESRYAQVIVAPSGTAHLVWNETAAGQTSIAFASRLPTGGWTAPEILSTWVTPDPVGDPSRGKPAIGIDAAGTVHVAWQNTATGQVYHASRSSGGSWSSPQLLANGVSAQNSSAPRLAVSAAGRVHVVWHSAGSGRSDIFYRGRDIAGAWGPLEVVTGDDLFATNAAYPAIAVDAAETAHLGWQNGIGYYASRPVSGTWSVPFGVTVWPFQLEQTHVTVDSTGQARLAWVGGISGLNAIVYATIEGGFATSPQLAYTSTTTLSMNRLLIDLQGRSQLGWSTGDGEVFLANNSVTGWSVTNLSASAGLASSQIDLLSTTSGLWATWREQLPNGTFSVACKKQTLDGQWHVLAACVNGLPGLDDPILAAGPDNQIQLDFGATSGAVADRFHVVWEDAGPRGSEVAHPLDLKAALSGTTLSFLYVLDIPAGEDTPMMTVTVESAAGSTAIFTRETSTNGEWTHVWRDLSAWSGEAVTLSFKLDAMAGVGRARLLLDEVNVGSVPADAWVAADAPAQALPGTTVVLDVFYGNHNGGIASGQILTATLPPGLTFVSAEPPPASTGPLTWILPDMAAGAGPFTIHITMTVAANQPSPSALSTTLVLSGGTVDVNVQNNQWTGVIFVGYRAHLPLIARP